MAVCQASRQGHNNVHHWCRKPGFWLFMHYILSANPLQLLFTAHVNFHLLECWFRIGSTRLRRFLQRLSKDVAYLRQRVAVTSPLVCCGTRRDVTNPYSLIASVGSQSTDRRLAQCWRPCAIQGHADVQGSKIRRVIQRLHLQKSRKPCLVVVVTEGVIRHSKWEQLKFRLIRLQ